MVRLLAALVAFMALSAPAYAYIDPGTGLLLLQGVIAIVGGFIMFVKHPIETVKRWIKRLRGRPDA